MRANIWNIRNSKERLGILQRTYAQKKHLESIFLAKSTINTNASLVSRNSSMTAKNSYRIKHGDQSENVFNRQSTIRNNNNSFSKSCEHRDLSRNLKTYSSLNRLIKKKAIQEENNKILCRIITVSPTLKRQSWAKMEEKNEKYKENLNRRKYKQLDYSKQALKLIKKSPKFKLIKMGLSSARSYDNFNKFRS